MDPVSLITSALTAGAVAALKETAGTAIKDAYQSLVSLVKNKFEKDQNDIVVVDAHAEDPDTWQKPLEKSIQESGVAEDEDILIAAKKLLELVHSQSSFPKYDVNIEGDLQGFVQGDNTKVSMNFIQPEKNRKKKK